MTKRQQSRFYWKQNRRCTCAIELIAVVNVVLVRYLCTYCFYKYTFGDNCAFTDSNWLHQWLFLYIYKWQSPSLCITLLTTWNNFVSPIIVGGDESWEKSARSNLFYEFIGNNYLSLIAKSSYAIVYIYFTLLFKMQTLITVIEWRKLTEVSSWTTG